MGEEPRNIIHMPSHQGTIGVIATWGNISVQPIDSVTRNLVASGQKIKIMMADLIGDYSKSAKENLPLYIVTGGPGFVWVATKKGGKGTLKFTALNPSLFYSNQSPPPQSAQETPRQYDGSSYAKIGWWTGSYRIVGNMNGCDATAQYQDQTFFQMSLIQSVSSEKEWAMFISNPRWNNWVAKKRQHTLQFVADDRRWRFYFSANDRNTLSVFNVKTDVINDIADADALKILSEDYGSLAGLDMKDSRAAIQAVVDCVRDHPPVVPSQRPTPTPTPTPTPQPETILSGTAFFVTSNRLVTNNHVVKDCKSLIEIKSPGQASHPVYIDAQDDTNDLALLHTDASNPSVASFHNGPRLGQQVGTYGFPYSGLLSSTGNFTLGYVTALSGMRDDSRFLQTSTPIQPGNSGGALIDMSGNVVGMLVSQLNAMLIMNFDGSIPQNVNFAIQTPIITNFLAVRGGGTGIVLSFF